jgi:hypothetical protein
VDSGFGEELTVVRGATTVIQLGAWPSKRPGRNGWLVRRSNYARRSLASHLIDARGTVEPNVEAEAVESRLRDGVFLWLDIDSPTEADF